MPELNPRESYGLINFIDNTIESSEGGVDIQIGLTDSTANLVLNRDTVLAAGKTLGLVDTVLGVPALLSSVDGAVRIDGVDGLQVGDIKIFQDTIESSELGIDIQLGNLDATANLVINRNVVLSQDKSITFPDNTVQTTAYTGGGAAAIADFVFTAEEGQSTISLPGDKQMRIQSGEDSDLYLTAGDDLYIQTLGFGDDIWVQAADDIRFTAGRENLEQEGGRSYGWSMNSEGEFHLPENGYISNPYATVVTSGNRSVNYTDNYLNDQSGLNQANSVALPVDLDTTWFVDNVYSGIFTSPAVISFADGDSATAVAIYDATSQGTPAVIFQWNDLNRQKTFEQTFPLNISVDYTITTYDGTPTIVLDPADNNDDQVLVIEATAPNHIHLRAGGVIDQSTAELFLGGEDTHVKIADQFGSVEILGTDITIRSNAVPSSLNINTYNGATINSARTSSYSDEDKVVATLGDLIPGVQGEPGPQGDPGTGFRFMGEWDDVRTFVIDDVVTFEGECYVAIQGSTVEYPPNTQYWAKIAAKGADADVSFQSVRWTPDFTATGLTFTGTGDTHPTYNSHYIKQGQLVSFWIAVDCSTVTSFGTGQLKIDLPFAPLAGTMNHFSGWVFVDETANPDMAGHIIVNADHLPNTQTLDLHYIKQQGGANSPVMEAMLKQGTPITLTTLTNIYVNGTYIAQ